MHMPDGILPINQAAIYLAISGIIILIAVWQSRKSITMKQIPMLGVLAAALFAAQLYNVPISFGSSGHLIGTALVTTIMGPWSAILVMSSILMIQMMFGDGGILAFGVNVLNMAIIAAFTTFIIFYFLPKKWRENKRLFSVVAGIAGFISVLLISIFASVELIIAQAGSAKLIFSWMVGLHAIIGCIEAAITFAIVFFLFRADPSIFESSKRSLYNQPIIEENLEPEYKFPIWAAVTSVGVFVFMSLYGIIVPLIGGDNPDGLERTFDELVKEGSGLTIIDNSLLGFPDGLGWEILQLAIIMTILFLLMIGISYIVYKLKSKKFHKIKEIKSSDENLS